MKRHFPVVTLGFLSTASFLMQSDLASLKGFSAYIIFSYVFRVTHLCDFLHVQQQMAYG